MRQETGSSFAADGDGAASCPHRPPCPGCPRYGEPGVDPTALATLRELAHRHGLPDVPVISGATSGFRLRARLAIRGRRGSPRLGMFELGTHRLVHIPNCSVHHPLINRVAAVVRRALVDADVSTYSETAHAGLARYLQVVVERSSQSAQVVLVANAPTAASMAPCLDLIRERLGEELHSLWFNAHCERSNTILGPTFQNWCGPDSVVERFGGTPVHYPPGAFGQNNLEIAERIVDHVRTLVPPGARVAEFYAGVGAIGLSLLPRVARLRMNEVGPHSLQGMALGLAELDPASRAKIEVVAGPAAQACSAASGAEVVIADPPRRGMDRNLLEYLRDQPPGLLLYVSCDLDSLMRDTAQLTAPGRLRLRALTAFNLMPYTGHVETLACFSSS